MAHNSVEQAVPPDCTDNLFLGGQLEIWQPKAGFRAAIDSVALPAAITSRFGVDILEVGLGAGVASLCLIARLPEMQVTGWDVQEHLVALAERNAVRNRAEILVQTINVLNSAKEAERPRFSQVMSNPPYLDAGRATPPPNPEKARANMLEAGTTEQQIDVSVWIAACLVHLKPRGHITLVHRADKLDEILAALSGKAGDVRVFPLWPRLGRPAERVIVRARLGAKGPAKLLAGLVLHGEETRYTEEAEAVLRHGAAIALD